MQARIRKIETSLKALDLSSWVLVDEVEFKHKGLCRGADAGVAIFKLDIVGVNGGKVKCGAYFGAGGRVIVVADGGEDAHELEIAFGCSLLLSHKNILQALWFLYVCFGLFSENGSFSGIILLDVLVCSI